MHSRGNNASKVDGVSKSIIRSGPTIFGFSHPEILKIMQLNMIFLETLRLYPAGVVLGRSILK
ncbi:hypothetical protein AgCh_012947 [Apium graveolens]